MKERTLRMHFKLLRLGRGMLNLWETWLCDEAIDVGLIEVVKDADPVLYHRAIQKSSAPLTGRVSS